MSGYRCVNYYELCRLCTSTASHGTKKVHIFSEEGRKKNLYEKIANCLPIVVSCKRFLWFLIKSIKSRTLMIIFFLIGIILRSVKRTDCQKLFARNVWRKLKRLWNSVKHAWMPSRCLKAVWIHRNCETEERFVNFFSCSFFLYFVVVVFLRCFALLAVFFCFFFGFGKI